MLSDKELARIASRIENGVGLYSGDAEAMLAEVRRLREPRELFIVCPACSCDQLEFDPATNRVECTSCDYDGIENRELAVTAERRKHETTLENLRSCNRYAAHLERELHALDGRPVRFADLVEAQDAGELVLPNRPPGSPPRPASAPAVVDRAAAYELVERDLRAIDVTLFEPYAQDTIWSPHPDEGPGKQSLADAIADWKRKWCEPLPSRDT